MSSVLEYEVDGLVITTDDELIDGRVARVSAGRAPPSGYVMIRIDGGLAQSVGLEEQIRLVRGERAVFRTFEADHVNTLTVNERGWEWGADEISETDVRAIGRIADDHELLLDSDGDHPIPRGGSIRLSGHGVERIVSRKVEPKLITIVVNARKREVQPGTISFEELVCLAFPTPPSGPNVSLTVSWRKGPSNKPEGSLLPGQSIHVVEGMTFNVTATDKS